MTFKWLWTPSGENLQGFSGVLRWLWDAPLPSHLIGGALWLLFARYVIGMDGWRLAAVVLAILAVQQGAKWDSVRDYGWGEIVPRLTLGMIPTVVYLLS